MYFQRNFFQKNFLILYDFFQFEFNTQWEENGQSALFVKQLLFN